MAKSKQQVEAERLAERKRVDEFMNRKKAEMIANTPQIEPTEEELAKQRTRSRLTNIVHNYGPTGLKNLTDVLSGAWLKRPKPQQKKTY